MSNTLRTAIAGGIIAGIAAVALPVAAQASSIYPPSDACSVSTATTTPGGTVTFSCADGTFAASEPVTITVTGEGGTGTDFGFLHFEVSTASTTVTSGAAGELPGTEFTLPSGATGIYNIAAFSASSAGGAASVTVTSDGTADGLSTTGGDAAELAIWVGVGLLAVAAGSVAVVGAARRRRHA